MFFGILVVLKKIAEENLVKSSTEKWQIIFYNKFLTSTSKTALYQRKRDRKMQLHHVLKEESEKHLMKT